MADPDCTQPKIQHTIHKHCFMLYNLSFSYRYLCYNSPLSVACVDGNPCLTSSASKFDSQLEASVAKMKVRGDTSLALTKAPLHVTAHIEPHMDMHTFHETLRDAFQEEGSPEYSIIGEVAQEVTIIPSPLGWVEKAKLGKTHPKIQV